MNPDSTLSRLFTAEVFSAGLSLIVVVLIGFFPGSEARITAIQVAASLFGLAIIAALTVQRSSVRQAQTLIQIAQLQADAQVQIATQTTAQIVQLGQMQKPAA